MNIGTLEDPLFNIFEISNYLGIRNVEEIINKFKVIVLKNDNNNDEIFVTDDVLLDILLCSRKPIEKTMELWNELKNIRQEREKLLKAQIIEKDKTIKDFELQYSSINTYQETRKTQSIYILKMDGGYKVGRTKNAMNRFKNLQTGNYSDIEIILEKKTSNNVLLERIIHNILDKYRCESNREFFDCNIEYMKNIVNISCNIVDTLLSTMENISIQDIQDKICENLECNPLKRKQTFDQESTISSPFNEHIDWIKKNLEIKEGSRISLQEICHTFKPGMRQGEKSLIKRYIEKEFNISCTKLKIDSKIVHGFYSLYFT
jgi:hypothetical protein